MKILFICNLFSPANNIAAIRPTKIAKYLSSEENDIVSVYAQNDSTTGLVDEILEHDIMNKSIDVHYVNDSKIVSSIQSKLENIGRARASNVNPAQNKQLINSTDTLRNSLKKSIIKVILYGIRRFIVINKSQQMIKSLKSVDLGQYDVAISFGPNCSDYVGRYIKRRNKSIKWIADFRDPFFNESIPRLFWHSARQYGTKLTRTADYVVAVSPGYLKSLNIHDKVPKSVITNGYDKEDIRGLTLSHTPNSKLTFTCVGALYKGKRKIDPIFRAIYELSNEKQINANKVQVVYAGGSENDLFFMANQYGLSDIIVSHGSVTRENSLTLQMETDVLLLPTWSDFEGQDIIPGKFLEYLMMNKPIIMIVGGKAGGGYVADICKSLRLGHVYEECNDSWSYKELKRYVLECYHSWLENKKVVFLPDTNAIQEYSYDNIARKYSRIIQTLVYCENLK